MMKTCDLWKLCSSDWVKGLVVAVLTAPLTIVYESVQAGALTLNGKTIALAAMGAGLAYILKQLGTGSSGKLLTNKEEVKK
jgi:hypothetical protein